MRADLRAFVVVVAVAGAAFLDACYVFGIGLPCDVASQCAADQACVDGTCVAEGEAGEGEGDVGEGEGDVGEGEGDVGEGEGEGDVDPGCPIDTGASRVARLDERCYAVFDGVEPWAAAAFRCASIGGHLAVPTSDAEEALLVDITAVDADPWLGVVDAQEDQRFVSLTDEEVDGSALFLAGEPNDDGGDERCVALFDDDDGGADKAGWSDVACEAPAGLRTTTLCELPSDAQAFCGDGVAEAGLGECDAATQCTADCPALRPAAGMAQVFSSTTSRLFIGFARPLGFDEAHAVCRRVGAEMAAPANAAENEAVASLASILGRKVWIGFTDDNGAAGTDAAAFIRVEDGSAIGDGFESFGGGEPSNDSGDDGVEEDAFGDWNDIGKGDANAVACVIAP